MYKRQALSGINKRKLDALGCKYRCLVAEEETANLAKEKGITRSMAAVAVSYTHLDVYKRQDMGR